MDFGHKVLGSLGIGAGSQPEAGLYVANKFFWYSANDLVDRNGRSLPVGLDLDAIADGVGVGGTYRLPKLPLYLNASLAYPFVSVNANTDRPEASLDTFGFGDLYVQPLRLGLRLDRVDAVVGYAFYAPTGKTAPGGRDGVGRGQWTHEFSLGGTVYFDRKKEWQLSLLASYELNQKKLGIDVTRGDTIQIQGAASKALFRILELGLAGYGLLQVNADTGSAVPAPLRGARDRVFGLGPELAALIPPLRARASLRYEHDVAVRSRALGQILVFTLSLRALDFDGS